MCWAEFRKTKSGVKLHLRIQLFEQGVLPDAAVITPAKPADKTQMDITIITRFYFTLIGYWERRRFMQR